MSLPDSNLNAPATLVVCPLRRVPEVLAVSGARRLVSVLNAHLIPPTPPAILPEHHLKLAMSEYVEVKPGERHPAIAQLEQLVAFARDWLASPDAGHPLLIHCFSGLNRSTASAYIIQCALRPDEPATLIAHRLRGASETAAPNRMMIALADQILGRKGDMIGAIEQIGFGQPAAEGRPFAVPAMSAPGNSFAP